MRSGLPLSLSVLGLSVLGLSVLSLRRAQAQVLPLEPASLIDGDLERDCLEAVAEVLASERPTANGESSPSDPARDAATPAPDPTPAVLPVGRAVASLSEDRCLSILIEHDVPHRRLDPAEAEGVGIPIRLEGLLGGLRVESRGHSELHEIMDCRLAVALLSWAPRLLDAGVVGILHYSTYRPGARVAGTRHRSGHASALAIDLAVLVMRDGTEHEVLTAWEARRRGGEPCADYDEGPDSARLRRLVCSVARSELFQVVLTPHYDAAHANHVHLELRPDVTWQYVH